MMTMSNKNLSRFAVTFGLALAACSDPPSEGPDATGIETGTEDGDPGDGDGDPGDEFGEGNGDGDGDSVPACGNGALELDEACDDGNDVDDDGCTNACGLPACGDGILQLAEGEACDDGNAHPGDGCTVSCAISGAAIWDVVIDLGDQMQNDAGYEVVIDSEDNIGVLYMTGDAYRLAEFDSQGAPLWDFAATSTDRPNLALGPNDEFALGGKTNNDQGVTRLYDTLGNLVWTRNIAAANSSVLGVGFDGTGNVVAAGFHAGDDALLLRYDPSGLIGWSHFETDGVALGPVAVANNGRIWNVRTMPRQLESYTDDGVPGWVSPMLDDETYEDVVADVSGNVYLLSVSLDATTLSVSKYDEDGELVWNVDHDDANMLEIAGGLAPLPGGGVLVSGATNGAIGEADGLLVWYGEDGNVLIPDTVIDGAVEMDLDVLHDVVIDLSDGYGVAVGARQTPGSNSDLWIHKFEL
jgi:cysteine-rich repeat protein